MTFQHRNHLDQEKMKYIACTKCNKRFASGKEVEEHMEEHNQQNEGFQSPRNEKVCKYFRSGYCAKGDVCAFKHIRLNPKSVQACKRGQQCVYFHQNRCYFYHEEVGVQNPRGSQKQFRQIKECRFQEKCWNYSSCIYKHTNKGFQMEKRTNKPPLDARQMNTWINY